MNMSSASGFIPESFKCFFKRGFSFISYLIFRLKIKYNKQKQQKVEDNPLFQIC